MYSAFKRAIHKPLCLMRKIRQNRKTLVFEIEFNTTSEKKGNLTLRNEMLKWKILKTKIITKTKIIRAELHSE